MSTKSNSFMAKAGAALAVAFCFALSAMLLTACSGQQAASSSAASDQVAAVDPSSWKTLGDALAAQTESMGSAWSGDKYFAVLKAGDSIVRVEAEMDSKGAAAMEGIDWSADDVDGQIMDAIGHLPLGSVEDLTAELLSQDELDQLAGKTGKELVDDGFVFERYVMTGGDETGASFAKGNFSYMVTFGVSVPEDADDDGAAVMDAPVTQASFLGVSDAALDPAAAE